MREKGAITEIEKAAMEKLTEGSVIQFMTDDVVFALHESMINRKNAPSSSGSGDIPAPNLTSVELDASVPDRIERFNRGFKRFKYWHNRNKTGAGGTFQEWMDNDSQFDNTIRTLNGITDLSVVAQEENKLHFFTDSPINKNTKAVIILTGQPDGTSASVSGADGTAITSLDGVLGFHQYAFDPASIGNHDASRLDPSRYQLESIISLMYGVAAYSKLENLGKSQDHYQIDNVSFQSDIFPTMLDIFNNDLAYELEPDISNQYVVGSGILNATGSDSTKF